jgi:nucleoside-diphosphate-sugar epimerase
MKRLGGRFCSLRFSQIYDVEGACIRHQPWFGRIIAYAARGLDINLPPSMGVRNFIHVNDAAQVLVAAGYHPTADGVFDVIHPQSLTFHEIAEIAYSVFGKGGQISTDSRKQPFREIHFPDGLHTVETFNSIPYISLAAGISEIRDRGTWTEFGPLDVT